MEPLFPVIDSAKKSRPAWLSVGASFPDPPLKRPIPAYTLVPTPEIPPASLKPEPSLSNYKEYELVEREGLVQVLKWQVDFGSQTLKDLGELAGFEVPRYIRSSNRIIGQTLSEKANEAIIAKIDLQLGLKNAEKPRKRQRIHEIKWTSNPEFQLENPQNGPESFFLQRSRALNSLLSANPKDVKVWLELVNVQEKSISGRKGHSQIVEKQLCILDRALSLVGGGVVESELELLLRKVVELGRDNMEVSIWKHYSAYAQINTYWKYAIYLENCRFDTFSMTKLRESFANAFKMLGSDQEMDCLRVKLVGELAKYELMVLSKQAGYSEVSTGLLQALLMRVFLYDSSQELREIWDSEGVRIGEEAASIQSFEGNITDLTGNLSQWAETETKASNWRPVKASLQAEVADLMPGAVVLSEDIQLALNVVAGEATFEVQKAALEVFLRHWGLETCCSNCKSDAQLLSTTAGLFPLSPSLPATQLQYLVSTLAALLPVYAGREVRQWLVALEKQLNSQVWTRQLLSKCEDFSLWMEFAYSEPKAWNALRNKAMLATPSQKILFFYHSFMRILRESTLEDAISELLLSFDVGDTLSALCAAKAAAHDYQAASTYEGDWSLQRVSEATALWLLYKREDLEVTWSYFQSVMDREKACGPLCTAKAAEWICEQAASLLSYHEAHTHVYMKTALTEKYAELLSAFPRNPCFIQAFCRFQSDPLLALASLHLSSEYHSALLFPSLQPWQQAQVVKSIISSGGFPSNPSSFIYLWEQWVAGTEAESRALVAIRHLPFCKSLYVAAAKLVEKPEDFIAALGERELHLRLDPLIVVQGAL